MNPLKRLYRNLKNLIPAKCLAALCGILLSAPTTALSATNALGQFTVADGLQVSLFAAEPMVRNPTDMDIDERGRIWITEGVNYRSTFKEWGVLQPAGDRILILEDTNGDGQADKQTVFYQDPSVNAALGICVLGNHVIISDSPNVFMLTDTNGDGVADQRELLFTGIGGADHDHGMHSFSFGPDGKLYFNMGNEGQHLFRPVRRQVPLHGAVGPVDMQPVIDLDGREVSNHGKPYRMGMVFRCNLDGTGVETLGWNFRNNYEVAVDSFGTLWQSDNDDDGNRGVRINYVMEFGNYGYADEMSGAGWSSAWASAKSKGAPEDSKISYQWHQFDPGVVPNLLHTGSGSPTGITLYEGKLLPEVFRNQIIHCDAGARVVRCYPVQTAGAGFRADTRDILTSTDTWFRPSDVCTAPDGSIYVSDWNDAGVGGHNMADHHLATMTGRIYRIAPVGNRPSLPSLNLKTAAGCAAALQSPNQSTRYLAWSKLFAMQGKAEKALKKIWASDNPRTRARALQLLARIHGKDRTYLLAALQDQNPDIRVVGLRIARELKLDLIPLIKQLAADDSAQVRRECALALRHCPDPRAAALWAELAARYDGRDRWYLEALGIGADGQWNPFLDAWLARVGPHWNTPEGRELIWRSRGAKTPALLAQILQTESLRADQYPHFFRSFDFLQGPERDAAVANLLVSHSSALAETQPNTAPPPRLTLALEALNRLNGMELDDKPEVRRILKELLARVRGTPQFIQIVRDCNLRDEDPSLIAMATLNPDSSQAVEALRLVLNHAQSNLLNKALAGSNAVALAQALGNTGEHKIIPFLLPLLTNSTSDLSLRRESVRSLSKIQAGASSLLQLAESGQLPADLKLTAATALASVRWEKIQTRAAQLLPPAKSREAQPLPPISQLAGMRGDPTAGAAVFRRDSVGCLKCHQVNGEGIDFGPALSEIGTKLGKDALYESILDPSAGISFGYEAWQITLKNGDEAFGIILGETARELTVKAVGGIISRYKQSEVVGRTRQKISLMPAGLQQSMTRTELVDLVEYLSSLKQARAAR